MRGIQKAFTLVELTVVLIIVSICAFVVFPKIDSPLSDSSRLMATAKQLASMGQAAQNLAISSQGYTALHVDLEGGAYWVTTRVLQDSLNLMSNNLALKRNLPQGINFLEAEIDGRSMSTEDSVAILFGPEGESSTGHVDLVNGLDQVISVVLQENRGLGCPLQIQERQSYGL